MSAADRHCSQTPFSALQRPAGSTSNTATGPAATQGCTCGGHHTIGATMMRPAASPGGRHIATPAGALSASWGLLPARTCRPARVVLLHKSSTTLH